MNKKQQLSGIVLTLAVLGQIFAAWYFYDPTANTTIINLGWGIIFLSAIFGWLPIFTLRYLGNTSGRSYTSTTVLVDSGIYSIIRHPQYVAGMLLNIGLSLITFHWVVLGLGAVSLTSLYTSTYFEEIDNLQKFGESYRTYQKSVPRVNFLLGIYRALVNSSQENTPPDIRR
jgi:protein-S-isoprenylcysteine O-methyltransferase Ste14